MTDCINCIHGDVLHNEARDVIHGNVIIRQQGTYNTVCHNSGMSISFDKDGDIVCSGFERRSDK